MRGGVSALSVYWVVIQEVNRLMERTVCIQEVGGILVLEYDKYDDHITAEGEGRQTGRVNVVTVR
jgi:hypothetical protein